MTLLACINRLDARYFLTLTSAGHLSLLPLLFTGPELPSKLLLHTSYSLALATTLHRHSAPLSRLEQLYILLSVPVLIYSELLGSSSLPFLPLMVYSLYCAVGVIYSYARVYVHYLQS
jgi:alpha-1,3-glucosyltransferase